MTAQTTEERSWRRRMAKISGRTSTTTSVSFCTSYPAKVSLRRTQSNWVSVLPSQSTFTSYPARVNIKMHSSIYDNIINKIRYIAYISWYHINVLRHEWQNNICNIWVHKHSFVAQILHLNCSRNSTAHGSTRKHTQMRYAIHRLRLMSNYQRDLISIKLIFTTSGTWN